MMIFGLEHSVGLLLVSVLIRFLERSRIPCGIMRDELTMTAANLLSCFGLVWGSYPVVLERAIWDAGDGTWVSCMQGKHPPAAQSFCHLRFQTVIFIVIIPFIGKLSI